MFSLKVKQHDLMKNGNVETSLGKATNLNTCARPPHRLMQSFDASICGEVLLREEKRSSQHLVLTNERWSPSVGALLRNCCLDPVNGEGLCNCLVVAAQTQGEGRNENESMFVHAHALYSCLSPGNRKYINSSQPVIFMRFWGGFSGIACKYLLPVAALRSASCSSDIGML